MNFTKHKSTANINRFTSQTIKIEKNISDFNLI